MSLLDRVSRIVLDNLGRTMTTSAQYLTRVFDEASTAGVRADVAVTTVEAVRAKWPVEVMHGRRRQDRPSRRDMIRVGMEANGVGSWWRLLWTVGRWFIPAHIRVIIDAVIWAVDTYLEAP